MELVRKPTGIYWARGTDPNVTVNLVAGIVNFPVPAGLDVSLERSGHGLLNGTSRSGRSCCSTSEEPSNQSGALCG